MYACSVLKQMLPILIEQHSDINRFMFLVLSRLVQVAVQTPTQIFKKI